MSSISSRTARLIAFCIFGLALASCSPRAKVLAPPVAAHKPVYARNVIVFIGDGMGLAQVSAAAAHRFGQELDSENQPGNLVMETLPVYGYSTTFSGTSFVTDSAAAGTAIACGIKTKNGAIGQTADGQAVDSVAVHAKRLGKSVGVMSSVSVNHATPAAFYGHSSSRNSLKEIMQQFFDRPTVDVLLGAGIHGDDWPLEAVERAAVAANCKVFTCDNLGEMTPQNVGDSRVLGLFDLDGDRQLQYMSRRNENSREPILSDLTVKALELLSRNPKGFFLMVEGGSIDWAGHGNLAAENISETLEFDRAIERTIEFLRLKGQLENTLILVTADHETGGLGLNGPYNKVLEPEQSPEIGWTSTNHTAIPVPVYAKGPGAESFSGKTDNTFIHHGILQHMR